VRVRAASSPGGLKNLQGAGGVRLVAAKGLRDGPWHRRDGGKTSDGSRVVERIVEQRGVDGRSLDEPDGQPYDVRQRAGGKIVHDDNLSHPRQTCQLSHQVPADKAGSSGDD
jgi:hypothetical protein